MPFVCQAGKTYLSGNIKDNLLGAVISIWWSGGTGGVHKIASISRVWFISVCWFSEAFECRHPYRIKKEMASRIWTDFDTWFKTQPTLWDRIARCRRCEAELSSLAYYLHAIYLQLGSLRESKRTLGIYLSFWFLLSSLDFTLKASFWKVRLVFSWLISNQEIEGS